MANLTDAKLKPVSLKMVKQAIQAIKNAEPVIATDEEANEMINKVFGKGEQRYYIRKHGENVDYVTIQQFVDGVRNGTISYEYGKQLIIPYTDPKNNTTYDLPFNFGTVQTFQKEDGSSFTGLGLVAEYIVPTSYIQFDNKEPNNPDTERQQRGNNRWQYSNLRQWLNKSGKNWYEPQHEFDAAPTTPDPTTTNGFLSCIPKDFVDSVIPVKNVTKTHPVDGGGYDTTYDKFFPLSLSQANIKIVGNSLATGDESEGRYWEYCRTRVDSTEYLTDYLIGSEYISGIDLLFYNIEDYDFHDYGVGEWQLRSAYLNESSAGVWNVDADHFLGNLPGSNVTMGVVPACVIG